VCNELCKIVWKKCYTYQENPDGTTYFYTYPHGNSYADLASEDASALFCRVMFHIVRCSLLKGSQKRVAKVARKTTVEDTAKKERFQPGYVSHRNKPIPKAVPHGCHSVPGGFKRGVALDGSEFYFGPFDFTGWSQEEIDKLCSDLELQEKYGCEFTGGGKKVKSNSSGDAKTASSTMEL
jgi:hypothetical protein